MQPSKKNIAHFILRKLLKDSIEKFGSPYLITADGSVLIYRNGKHYSFAESKVSFRYLIDNSDYSLKQIMEASNLLMANNHIIIEGTPLEAKIEDTVIKATTAGILAYQEQYYMKFNYEKWTFWIGVVVATLLTIVSLILSLRKS